MTISQEFARQAAILRDRVLPHEVVARAKHLLLDFCGNALGGASTDSFRLAASGLTHVPDGPYTVVGHRSLVLPEYAALLNGLAAHSLETDDIQNNSSIHMGAVVFPALLAVSECIPVNGANALCAMVAGYEVLGRIGRALNPGSHYAKGFHPTATCGPYGAAMAASCLLGLSEEKTVNALGIASVGSAGLLEFLADGSLTKRLHPGWAGHAGLIAAFLARRGYTGPREVFEGANGFLRAYSDHSEPALAAGVWEPLGRELLDTAIKPHACCRYNHAAIDGVIEMVEAQGLRPEDIEYIRVGVLSAAWTIVVEPIEQKRRPKSVVDAQFSLPFAAAVAALYRRASVAEYSPDVMNAPAVRDLMQRVICFHDASLDALYPQKWPATVEIESRQGRAFRTRVEHPRGDPENPLAWEDIVTKFHLLAASVSPEVRGQIIRLVAELEALPDMGALTSALAGRSESAEGGT